MHMEQTKPSSKVVALAIVVIAIVAATWLIRSDSKAPGTDEPDITVTGTEKTYTEELDTDGDGLKNWEEMLWGFDPNNPDTDGDGISDATEKQEAQNTALTRQQEFAKLIDPTDDPNWESLSYTEQVSGLLLSNYLALKQSGQPLSKDDALAIVQSIPAYDPPEQTAPRVYSLSDVRASAQSDEKALREYGNDVGALLSVPEGDEVKNELIVLVSFMQTGDETTFLRDLKEVIAQYDYVLAGLLQISVPKNIVSAHLGIINALSLVRSTVNDFHSFTEDPLLALSVFTTYNESTTRRGEAFRALRTVFENADITFSKTEPGYLLINPAAPSS